MIVEQKLQSELEALKIEGRNEKIIDQIRIYRESVYTDDQTNREASAARIYFQEMFGLAFTRDDDTVINYALNYGYKIIASYISKCIASRGLLTQLGIHHIGESNPFNLTYDFIEPLRVIVDLWVVENIKDTFNTSDKREIIDLLNYKVCLNGKMIRLNDAIEDLVDSYIAFLDERTNEILCVDYSYGMRSV